MTGKAKSDADAVRASGIFALEDGRGPKGSAAEGGCDGSCYSDFGMISR